MKDLDYGISNAIFGNDEVESKTVKFGDGNTLISGVSWGENGFGICLVRNRSDAHQPFQSYKNGELNYHVNQSPNEEKVYIVFDNIKSADALIYQLKKERDEFEMLMNGGEA